MRNSINLKKAGLLIALVSLFCVGILINALSVKEVVESPVVMKVKTWQPVGDATLSGDDSGFLTFMVWDDVADPATTYATNLSNASADCYEYLDSLDGEMTGETPYSTAVNYVLKIRVNDTVGYNTSSSQWMPSWIYPNITVDFDTATDVSWTSMTMVEVTNNSNFAWYQCYIDNGGAGYTITHNEKFNATVNCSMWW